MARFEVGEEDADLRIDVFLRARLPSLSRTRSKALAAEGHVRLDGRRCKKGARVQPGQVVSVELGDDPGSDFRARPNPALPLSVLYEDAECVVVDKPAQLPMHPLRAEEERTLCSALVARYPEMASVGYGPREPGILHRLDNDTTGVVLAARSSEAFERLRGKLARGAFDKRYMARVVGRVRAPQVLDMPLATGKKATRTSFDERRVNELGSQAALTEVLHSKALEGDESLVTVRARSARRHQVRAHLAAYGHPLIGDVLYGGPARAARHLLHASSIGFESQSGSTLVEAPLPADFEVDAS